MRWYRKTRCYWLWLRPPLKLPEFFTTVESVTHTFNGKSCHQDCGDPLYSVTGVKVHFRYKKKLSRFCLAWSRPCTDRSKNWTDDYIPCNNVRSLPNFIHIDQHVGEWRPKNLFSTHNRGPPLHAHGRQLVTISIQEYNAVRYVRFNQQSIHQSINAFISVTNNNRETETTQITENNVHILHTLLYQQRSNIAEHKPLLTQPVL